jgi:hypothetical protein
MVSIARYEGISSTEVLEHPNKRDIPVMKKI